MSKAKRQSYWTGLSIAAVVVLLTSLGIAKLDHNNSPASAGPGPAAREVPAAPSVHESSSPKPPLGTDPVDTRQWALSWSDNFSSPASLDKWSFVVGNQGGPALGQLQWYDRGNAQVDGHGHLVITATAVRNGQACWNGPCQYTSVRMDTIGLFAQRYGIFEARIKLPRGRGLWPAFWMQGVNYSSVGLPRAGEIDIAEINNREHSNVLTSFAHAPRLRYQNKTTLGQSLSASYHIFGIEWTRNGTTWLVDGKAYAHLRAYPHSPFNQPFNMILNLAVGGGWPGSPDSTTHFPAHMYVDWVRVYQHK